MGATWRDHPAWSVVERAEAALGEPLAHLLLAESADDLARTRESQLSILLTWLANDNAPGQIVIAGTPSGIERATKAAACVGIRRVMPLNVGGAFHTPLMAEAAAAVGPVLAGITFAAPVAPIVSNADARPYRG